MSISKEYINILCFGYLTKSPPKSCNDFFQIKRWKKRFCVLKTFEDKLIFEYRKSEASKDIKGSLDLQFAAYLVTNFPYLRHRRNMFSLKVADDSCSRIYYFNATSSTEMDQWVNIIRDCCNLRPSTMTRENAEELVLAGFLSKSSTKDFQELVEMLQKSLNIFEKKTENKEVVIETRCKKFYEVKRQSNSSNVSDLMMPLPVRCTSTLSSDSSSSDSENDMNGAEEDDPQRQDPPLSEPTVSKGDTILLSPVKTVPTQSAPELQYLTHDDLQFTTDHKSANKGVEMEPANQSSSLKVNKVKPIKQNEATEVQYSEIDSHHTEALFKLQKRMDQTP